MKRVFLLLALILPVFVNASAAQEIAVTLDGEAMEFDVPPAVIADRAMVPMRTIFEALGAEVEWLEADQIIIAAKGSLFVSLKIGSEVMIVQDLGTESRRERILLDSPPVILGERTLVPVRVVSESLGAAVMWDAETSVVRITTPKEAEEEETEQTDKTQNDENGGQ